MNIPFLSRLGTPKLYTLKDIAGYFRLLFAFSILLFESTFRILFTVLPINPLISLIRSSFCKVKTDPRPSFFNKKANISTSDFAIHWDHPVETHYVKNEGFLLALHRIGSKTTPFSKQKPAVLLWHGFLMCSEVWVCIPTRTKNLPFVLADAGYDVWLGNSRGNKYSCKNSNLNPNSYEFWNFSIDDLSLSDFPAVVDYILDVCKLPDLTYIGFSQGTAQGFAGLSMNANLNSKVNLFIALAPVMKPSGLENKIIQTLVSTSPDIIYLIFGRKILLRSFHFWKGRLQMYDEFGVLSKDSGFIGHETPHYNSKRITTPVALFYGGRDTLPDMNYLFDQLDPIFILKIEEFEHLHFLWGNGCDRVVFPGILVFFHVKILEGLLGKYNCIHADTDRLNVNGAEIAYTMKLGNIDFNKRGGSVFINGKKGD